MDLTGARGLRMLDLAMSLPLVSPVDARVWARFFGGLHAAEAARDGRLAPDDAVRRLRRARAFIDHGYDGPLDLESIAAAAALSRFHLLRRFKDTYGETPHAYLTRRRIERAKELLAGTDLPVTQVCLEVGFASLGSFSTLFSRHVGHSPDRFRRRWVAVPDLPRPIPACFLAAFAMR
jgi:AraC-like DNA-binding protein